MLKSSECIKQIHFPNTTMKQTWRCSNHRNLILQSKNTIKISVNNKTNVRDDNE